LRDDHHHLLFFGFAELFILNISPPTTYTEYERDIWQPSPMRAHPDAGYGIARRRRRNRVRGKDSTVFSRRRRRLQ
jgi:hypothetical protein